MDNHSDRPERTRTGFLTLELCKNRKAGENGSVELIVSALGFEQPTFYFWPLDANGAISPDQWTDLQGVLLREVTDHLLVRFHVQPELFTAP